MPLELVSSVYESVTLQVIRDMNLQPPSTGWSWKVGQGAFEPASPVLQYNGDPDSPEQDKVHTGDLVVYDFQLDTTPAACRFKPQPFQWVGMAEAPQPIAWSFLDGHGEDERRQIRIAIINPDTLLSVQFSLQVGFDVDGAVLASPDPTIVNRKPPGLSETG